MSDSGSIAPAGWHPDPGGSGQLRWWDGTAWTHHLTPGIIPPTATPVVAASPAVAEVPEPTYRTFSSSSSNASAQDAWGSNSLAYDDSAMGWNTPAGWALAFTPVVALLSVALLFGAAAAGVHAPWTLIAIAVLPLLYAIVLAFRDRRRLVYLGIHRPASAWWILLFSPLLYLVIRTVRVFQETRRGIAPLITYVVLSVVVGIGLAAGAALLTPLILQQLGSAVSGQVATKLETDLNAAGGNFDVTCPPTVTVTVGSTFTCTAVERGTAKSTDLTITVVSGPNGAPKLTITGAKPSAG